MLKLKLQYFGHLMGRVDSLEKTLMLGGMGAGGEGDDRGWDGWMASPTRWTWVWVNSGSWYGQGGLACCDSWGRKVLDTTERQNWTELILSHLLEYRFSIFLIVLYSFFMGMKADMHLFLCWWSSSQNSGMLAAKCIEDLLVQFHQLKILKSGLINNLNR